MQVDEFIKVNAKFNHASNEWHSFYPKFWQKWLEQNDLTPMCLDVDGDGKVFNVAYDKCDNNWALTVYIKNVFGEYPFYCNIKILDGWINIVDYDPEYNESSNAFPYVRFEFVFAMSSQFYQWLLKHQPNLVTRKISKR